MPTDRHMNYSRLTQDERKGQTMSQETQKTDRALETKYEPFNRIKGLERIRPESGLKYDIQESKKRESFLYNPYGVK